MTGQVECRRVVKVECNFALTVDKWRLDPIAGPPSRRWPAPGGWRQVAGLECDGEWLAPKRGAKRPGPNSGAAILLSLPGGPTQDISSIASQLRKNRDNCKELIFS